MGDGSYKWSGNIQVIIEYNMSDTCNNEGRGRETVSEGLLMIHSYLYCSFLKLGSDAWGK